jgi:hypothetical protein
MKISDLDMETKAVILWSKFFTEHPSHDTFKKLRRRVKVWYSVHRVELDSNLLKMVSVLIKESDEKNVRSSKRSS